MKYLLLVFPAIIFLFAFSPEWKRDEKDPWTKEQLMEPSELVRVISDSTLAKPVIISVGPVADIKGDIDFGSVSEEQNMKKYRNFIKQLPKDTSIVIYCGCCPFDHCPNVRPAFTALKEAGFTDFKLLNLTHNIKIDWINEGYPRHQ